MKRKRKYSVKTTISLQDSAGPTVDATQLRIGKATKSDKSQANAATPAPHTCKKEARPNKFVDSLLKPRSASQRSDDESVKSD